MLGTAGGASPRLRAASSSLERDQQGGNDLFCTERGVDSVVSEKCTVRGPNEPGSVLTRTTGEEGEEGGERERERDV